MNKHGTKNVYYQPQTKTKCKRSQYFRRTVVVWSYSLIGQMYIWSPDDINIQGVPEKTVQSLVHLNFATVSQKIVPFSLKCSEINRENE